VGGAGRRTRLGRRGLLGELLPRRARPRFVLREAKAALKPGGAVIVSECLRPSIHDRPTHVEFVFDFLESFTNVATDPILRRITAS